MIRIVVFSSFFLCKTKLGERTSPSRNPPSETTSRSFVATMRAMSSTNASAVASCSHRASSSSSSSSARAHVRRVGSSARAGRVRARAFELDVAARARALPPGVRANRRARRAIVTAMSDAVASGDGDDDGDAGPSRALGRTRLQRVVDSFRKQSLKRAKRNLTKLPLALISLLVGFSICALLPHPESPQDAFISFTIILLSEFVSSVLYGGDNQGGILRWVRDGDWLPTVLNCFKIGVLYGLFCDAFKVGS